MAGTLNRVAVVGTQNRVSGGGNTAVGEASAFGAAKPTDA